MISLTRARKCLGKKYENITDEELLELLATLYQLAELAIASKNISGSK